MLDNVKNEPARPASPTGATPQPQPKSTAMIGPSISIKGDLYGEEDIVIQGRVEGTVKFNRHNLTVGKDGVVKADVTAKSITVEGQVKGDLRGEDLITIKKSGNTNGSLTAPRVALEDGAKFKGSIEMGSDPSAADNKKSA